MVESIGCDGVARSPLYTSSGQTTGQYHIYRFTAESAEFTEEGDNERGRFVNRPLLLEAINDV